MAQPISDIDFSRPPVKTTIYLKFSWSCRTSLWYFFEDDEENRLNGTIGFGHQVNPKLEEIDWNTIRQWVDGCLERHGSDCVCHDKFNLPGFKVIDCQTRKIVSKENGADFAALSYVWGSPQMQPDKTNGVSRTHTSQNILPRDIPETVIDDAVTCATKLNVPYLWVDRYCIDQKPTTREEHDTKQRLIQSMGQIYSAAKLTIISVAGDDATTGLPGVSKTLRVSPLSGGVIGSHKIVPVINPNDSIRASKWAGRGWTLQEGLLARRRLVFTDTRVLFQCTQSHHIEGLFAEFNSNRHGEDYDSDPRVATRAFPGSIIGSSASRFSIGGVCDEFTSRDLTSDGDALNACLGIFSRFWASKQPQYQYYGMPFQGTSGAAFAVALLWKFRETELMLRLEYGTVPFRRSWGPSWSWVAWKGQIHFGPGNDNIDLENLREYVWLVDIKVPRRHGGQDIMSTIGNYIEDIDKGGLYQHWLPYLRLSGWITTLQFDLRPIPQPGESYLGDVRCFFPQEKHEMGCGQILPPMWAKLLNDDDASNPSRLLDVIFIAGICDKRMQCLIIHRIGDEHTDTYERLGMCEFYYLSPEIRQVGDKFYKPARKDWGSRETWDLECRFETITLV